MNVLKGIPLPKIAKKLAIINLENEDNERLKRAIVRALNSVNTYTHPSELHHCSYNYVRSAIAKGRHSEGPP